MLKIPVENVRVKVSAKYRRAGSILAGTATAGCDGVHLELRIDSEASPEQLQELVRVAEASCYTAGALREPVPIELEAIVNGEPLPVPSSGS